MDPMDIVKSYINQVPGAGISPYSYFGDQEDTIRKQGWYPATDPDSNKSVTFRAPYDAPFNTVQIEGDKKLGHVAIVGRPSGKFDIVINHADGNLEHAIMQGVTAKDVESWITSPNNTIAQRISGLQKKQFDPMSGQQVKSQTVASK